MGQAGADEEMAQGPNTDRILRNASRPRLEGWLRPVEFTDSGRASGGGSEMTGSGKKRSRRVHNTAKLRASHQVDSLLDFRGRAAMFRATFEKSEPQYA